MVKTPGSRAKHAVKTFKRRMWVDRVPDEKRADDNIVDDEEVLVENEERFVTFRFITCFSVLCAALCLAALDYSGTGNIMAQIGNDLDGSTTEVEWIGNGYALAACVFQLPISALSDIFGRKALLMTSLALVFIGSVASATAQNMDAMIAGRVIQGAGGGGCYVLPEVILADNVPLRQRSIYYSVFMIFWALFSGMAPLIAGALAEYASWRWFFYLNLFLAGAAFLASPFCIKLKNQAGHDNAWWVKLGHIDYVGGLLTIGSGVTLLLGLSRGGSTADLPWSSASVILPLVFGIVGFGLTVVYEYWRKPAVPMFNIRVFSNTSASICYLHNVLQGIINLCSIYYLPSFFQGAKGYGQVVSGACILPLNLVGPPVVSFFGILIQKTGHYHIVNLAMWGLCTAGMGLMTLYDGSRNLAELLFLQVVGSIGISCLYATLSITANATNPPELWTESTAMMSFFRALGDTLGTSIGGAVLASQMRSRLANLADQGFKVPTASNVLTLVDSINHSDNPAIKKALVLVFSGSIRTLFIVLTVFSAISFLLTLLQKEYSLDQCGESKQGIDD